MKVSAIINTMKTYNGYQAKLKDLKAQWVEADAFDDETDKKEIEKKIDNTNKELGRFLDMEV